MNVIITGASKGIGKEIANVYAQNITNNLLLVSRNSELLLELKKQLFNKFKNNNIFTYNTDLSIKQNVLDFADWCLSFGNPSILINNVGFYEPNKIINEDNDFLEKMLNVNLLSAYYLTKSLLPKMLSNNSGHIFNICSVASLQAYPNGGSYSISKFALLGFSKNLREELKNTNIKVTSIIPGATFTDSWLGSGVNEERLMEANDIAQIIYTSSNLSKQAVIEEIILRPQKGDL